jgi:hypothetical protein
VERAPPGEIEDRLLPLGEIVDRVSGREEKKN